MSDQSWLSRALHSANSGTTMSVSVIIRNVRKTEILFGFSF